MPRMWIGIFGDVGWDQSTSTYYPSKRTIFGCSRIQLICLCGQRDVPYAQHVRYQHTSSEQSLTQDTCHPFHGLYPGWLHLRPATAYCRARSKIYERTSLCIPHRSCNIYRSGTIHNSSLLAEGLLRGSDWVSAELSRAFEIAA